MSNNFGKKRFVIVGGLTSWGTAPSFVGQEITGFKTTAVDGGQTDHLDNSELSGHEGTADFIQAGVQGGATISLEKPVEFNRKFDLMALAGILGSYTSVINESILTHTIKQKKVLEPGEMLQCSHAMAHTEGTEAKVVPSFYFNSVALKYQNGRLEMICKGDGSHYVIGDGALYTLLTGLTEANYPGGYPTFSGLQILMNDTKDLSGDTETELSIETDKIKCSDLEIEFSRPAKALPVSSGDNFAGQPNDETGIQIAVKLKENTKTATNSLWLSKHHAAKSQKMTIVFTGPMIPGSTTPYSFAVKLPRLQIKTAPTYDMATPTPVNLELKAAEAIAIPTGFASKLTVVEVVNKIPALTGYPS